MEKMTREDPPNREQCLRLMARFEMLPNIKDHSVKVCEVSLSIARAAKRCGVDVDLSLVEAGALLHDITKTRELKTRKNHALTGQTLLEELGYPRTARVVGEHIIPEDRGDRLTSAEIVAYADKRVLHDRAVSLGERFEYLLEAYRDIPNAIPHFAEMRRRMEVIERIIEQVTDACVDDLLGL